MTAIVPTAMRVTVDHETAGSIRSPVLGRTEMTNRGPAKAIGGDPLKRLTGRSRSSGNV